MVANRGGMDNIVCVVSGFTLPLFNTAHRPIALRPQPPATTGNSRDHPQPHATTGHHQPQPLTATYQRDPEELDELQSFDLMWDYPTIEVPNEGKMKKGKMVQVGVQRPYTLRRRHRRR